MIVFLTVSAGRIKVYMIMEIMTSSTSWLCKICHVEVSLTIQDFLRIGKSCNWQERALECYCETNTYPRWFRFSGGGTHLPLKFKSTLQGLSPAANCPFQRDPPYHSLPWLECFKFEMFNHSPWVLQSCSILNVYLCRSALIFPRIKTKQSHCLCSKHSVFVTIAEKSFNAPMSTWRYQYFQVIFPIMQLCRVGQFWVVAFSLQPEP